VSDIKHGKFDYSFEVEARYEASPELLAAMKAGQDQLQTQMDDVLNAYNGAVDRAAMLLIDAGVTGVVAWLEPGGRTELRVDDIPVATVTGEYVRDDGQLLFNVETTWHPPYEHLAK
jgi:hypothetical protein